MDKEKYLISKRSLFRKVFKQMQKTGATEFKMGLIRKMRNDNPNFSKYSLLSSRIRPDNCSVKCASNKVAQLVASRPELLPFLKAYLNEIKVRYQQPVEQDQAQA